MRTTFVTALCAAYLLIGARASAQSRFAVSLLLGSTSATNEGAVLRFDRGTTYQVTFAWRRWQSRAAQLSFEIPFIASAAFTVIPASPILPLEYASLYLTPGIRVTAFPRSRVSFFGAVGARRSARPDLSGASRDCRFLWL
jgi:hypothetical protein